MSGAFTTINKVVASYRVRRLLELVIGFAFVYAGIVKLTDPAAFARLISEYSILPDILLLPFAVGLPLLEFLAGLGLALNRRGSLAVILGLLVLFSSVLGYGIFHNLDIDCGCFSIEEIKGVNSLKQAFYRDLAMAGAVFLLFIQRSRRLSGNPQNDTPAKNNKKG